MIYIPVVVQRPRGTGYAVYIVILVHSLCAYVPSIFTLFLRIMNKLQFVIISDQREKKSTDLGIVGDLRYLTQFILCMTRLHIEMCKDGDHFSLTCVTCRIG